MNVKDTNELTVSYSRLFIEKVNFKSDVIL